MTKGEYYRKHPYLTTYLDKQEKLLFNQIFNSPDHKKKADLLNKIIDYFKKQIKEYGEEQATRMFKHEINSIAEAEVFKEEGSEEIINILNNEYEKTCKEKA